MSILIRGMEMPTTCCNCKFREPFIGFVHCHLAEMDMEYEESDNCRHPNCPLVELPPHGRLGDLDALYAEISNGNKAYNGIEGYDGKYPNIANVDDCLDAIKYAETVIEAEGSET